MCSKKTFRQKLLLLLVLTLCFGLCSGCGKSKNENESIVDPNAPLSIENIREGIYIMSKDGKFYYPNTDGQNFSSEVTSADARRIICSKNDEKYIPTLYADDYLVYFTLGTIPTSFGVEKFYDSGYTCGLYGMSMGTNGNYTFSGGNLISGSSLNSSFNGYVQSTDVVSILSLNDSSFSGDYVTPAGTIRCSEKGQKLKISFVKGTFYNEIETIADEHIWYSEETMSIASYEMTKNGFIILRLPDSVKDGDYLSVKGTGLFQISEQNRPE